MASKPAETKPAETDKVPAEKPAPDGAAQATDTAEEAAAPPPLVDLATLPKAIDDGVRVPLDDTFPAGGGDRPFMSSRSITKIIPALVTLQTDFSLKAEYNRENEGFKRGGKPLKYADFAAVWEVLRPALRAAGLSVLQFPSNVDRTVTVRTVVLHLSGEWIASEFTMLSPDGTAHKMGSTITYAKRYALTTLLGVISDEDDDGNAGSGVEPRRDPPPRQQREREPPPKKEPEPRPSTPWVIVSRDGSEVYPPGAKEFVDAWGSRIASVLNSEKHDDAGRLSTLKKMYEVNAQAFGQMREVTDGKAVNEVENRIQTTRAKLEKAISEAASDGGAK